MHIQKLMADKILKICVINLNEAAAKIIRISLFVFSYIFIVIDTEGIICDMFTGYFYEFYYYGYTFYVIVVFYLHILQLYILPSQLHAYTHNAYLNYEILEV